MRLLWLPDVLRAAGLTVHLYSGWESRGSEEWGEDTRNASYRMPLQGLICHATASSRTSTPAGDTRVLWVTGSNSAPAPISQLYLARNGDWYVGASGRCNHVLTGTKGPHRGRGNYQLIGVEACNDNLGEPWPAVQVDSYHRGVAAICRHMGWSSGAVAAHWEHQDGKSDPLGLDMGHFRQRVAALTTGTLSTEEDGMRMVRYPDGTIVTIEGFNYETNQPYAKVQTEWLRVKEWIEAGHPIKQIDRPLTAAYWDLDGPDSLPLELDDDAVVFLADRLGPAILAGVKAEVRDAVADAAEGGAAAVRAE